MLPVVTSILPPLLFSLATCILRYLLRVSLPCGSSRFVPVYDDTLALLLTKKANRCSNFNQLFMPAGNCECLLAVRPGVVSYMLSVLYGSHICYRCKSCLHCSLHTFSMSPAWFVVVVRPCLHTSRKGGIRGEALKVGVCCHQGTLPIAASTSLLSVLFHFI